MTNWRPEDPEMYEDVQTRWNYAHTATGKTPQQRLQRMWRSSRDSARTPVQWSSEKNAGFTTGDKTWFHVNPNYIKINVAQQETDPDSVLNFYRKAIALRKSLSCVRHGSYKEFRPLSGKHYIYVREDDAQKLLVICSFAKTDTRFRVPRDFDLTAAELILCSVSDPTEKLLTPYETRVYLWKK